jgi:hypothetical protein
VNSTILLLDCSGSESRKEKET